MILRAGETARQCDRCIRVRAMMQTFKTSYIQPENERLLKCAEAADVPQHAASARQERLNGDQLL